MASEWLGAHVVSAVVPPTRSLLLVGDEHLAAAASSQLKSAGIQYTHVFPEAWIHWHDTQFRGNPGWWVTFHWAINNPVRLIHFAEFDYDDLELRPNESYLLSVALGSGGSDSICRLVNGELIVDTPYAEWVDSV